MTALDKIRMFGEEKKQEIIDAYFKSGRNSKDISEKLIVPHRVVLLFLTEELTRQERAMQYDFDSLLPKTPYYETEQDQMENPYCLKVPYYFKFEDEKTIGDIKK